MLTESILNFLFNLVEEETEEDGEENVDTKSNLENFKYYTSLFLGTLCLVKSIESNLVFMNLIKGRYVKIIKLVTI